MLKRLLKKFVYMDTHRNELGFTLISMLVTLTILFTTLPLLTHLTKSATYTSNYDEISVHQFFRFLRNEFMKATDYTIEKNVLKLDMVEDEIASIEKYKDIIRRRVDGGHEVYLRDVEEVSFTYLSYGVHVVITTLQGAHYEKTIIFYD